MKCPGKRERTREFDAQLAYMLELHERLCVMRQWAAKASDADRGKRWAMVNHLTGRYHAAVDKLRATVGVSSTPLVTAGAVAYARAQKTHRCINCGSRGGWGGKHLHAFAFAKALYHDVVPLSLEGARVVLRDAAWFCIKCAREQYGTKFAKDGALHP